MMRPFALAYVVAVAVSVLLIGALIQFGLSAHAPPAAWVPRAVPHIDGTSTSLGLLLAQIAVVLLVARTVGTLFRRLGQPAVIGEIVAGLLLGPSVLGALAPSALAALFPPTSLAPLALLSQVGVLLFMFLVGLDLDFGSLRDKARSAVIVSHTSIFVPFLLGVGLVLAAYPQLTAPGVPFDALALFMGIAMSVTAFPVLARILEERGLLQTTLGRNAIACAAIDDVSAWCLLAFVVALAEAHNPLTAAATVALSALFIWAMWFAVRPLLERLARVRSERGAEPLGISAAVIVLMCAAAATEAIGIHALFGAFMAGLAMPRDALLRERLRERLHSFATVVLLPLFFALTGLRTQLGLLDGVADFALCAAIVLIAVAGKLGGSALAARLTGAPWREALTIGALMNTRGLMELVVLNLGYDLGILSPRVFTMLVIMALVTTLMTGPLLSLLRPQARGRG
ncbi:cation:proton antiporter [Fontimonas sp. SYSU GA230001]|uniref:cation:proton antiporter domain-containing protein n=1 Tax=Fontimonas sp. SYSU GA230001 TaxID=3142450 RepID=UPI0032B384E2